MGDVELQAHWARYLCILSSGFLETAIRTIYSDCADNRADPRIAAFVRKRLERFHNPKLGKILELAQAFSVEWAEELKRETEGVRKAAVDSIVTNRNRISHGEDVGISYTTIREYHERMLEVVEIIDKQCSR